MIVTTGHGKPLIAGRMGSIKRKIGKSEVVQAIGNRCIVMLNGLTEIGDLLLRM
jgi:hypothetical protein